MVSFTRNQPEKLVEPQFERRFFSFVSIFSSHLMVFWKFYSTFSLKNKYGKILKNKPPDPAHFSMALPKPGQIPGFITIASSSLTYFCRRCCQRMLYLLMIPANWNWQKKILADEINETKIFLSDPDLLLSDRYLTRHQNWHYSKIL